jgi:hypothetical protein
MSPIHVDVLCLLNQVPNIYALPLVADDNERKDRNSIEFHIYAWMMEIMYTFI